MMMHGNAEKLTFWKMTDVILQIIMQNMVTVNMDSQTEMIIDFYVSHVDWNIHKYGIEWRHVLQQLDDGLIEIAPLTIDRHKKVRFFLRNNQKDICH